MYPLPPIRTPHDAEHHPCKHDPNGSEKCTQDAEDECVAQLYGRGRRWDAWGEVRRDFGVDRGGEGWW